MKHVALVVCLALVVAPGAAWAKSATILTPAARQEAARLNKLPPIAASHAKHPPIDRSGRKRKGKASYYARHFDNQVMADGNRFNPHSNIAASKTLPLGTTAKVVNLKTGKSAVVTIQDRGPYIDGRVIDVSPKVAKTLEMKEAGVVPVVVKPIAVPKEDGGVKLGAGAADTPVPVVRQSVKTTLKLASQ